MTESRGKNLAEQQTLLFAGHPVQITASLPAGGISAQLALHPPFPSSVASTFLDRALVTQNSFEYAPKHAISHIASNAFEILILFSECARIDHSHPAASLLSSLTSTVQNDRRPPSTLSANTLVLSHKIFHLPTLPSTQQRSLHITRKSHCQRSGRV